jgi:hypothetical protein
LTLELDENNSYNLDFATAETDDRFGIEDGITNNKAVKSKSFIKRY